MFDCIIDVIIIIVIAIILITFSFVQFNEKCCALQCIYLLFVLYFVVLGYTGHSRPRGVQVCHILYF